MSEETRGEVRHEPPRGLPPVGSPERGEAIGRALAAGFIDLLRPLLTPEELEWLRRNRTKVADARDGITGGRAARRAARRRSRGR